MAKRALITGGGSGIGLAVANRLRSDGFDVVVAGRTKSRLESTGFDHVVMDVSDAASVAAAMQEAGPVDVFVANAGAASSAPFAKTGRELWDHMLAVNLTSVYLCAQAALPPMIEKKWGRFIVVASTAGLQGYAYTSAYCAAKHGVVGLIRGLALEMARTGVTVNAICPGFTDTDIVASSVDNIMEKTGRSKEDALKALTRTNPMGRLVAPDEVADLAANLAGEGAGSINGQAFAVDGGETIG